MTGETLDKARFFSATLKTRLGENLARVVLFGSRARGDARDGSDYDFLVIVKRLDPQVKQQTIRTAVDFLNRYDELAGSLVYDETGWLKRKNLPVAVAIEREGIPL